MRRGLVSPIWTICPWLLVLVAGLLVSYFPVRVVYTREKDAIQGEWTSCRTITESRQEGDSHVITATVTANFKGIMTGVCEAAEREAVRKDGTQSFRGSGLFTGEINGRAGTAILTYSGTIDQKGAINTHWVLDKGTDKLARVEGQGTLDGTQTHDPKSECGDPESQSAWSGSYRANIE